jgi:hypothetical protein
MYNEVKKLEYISDKKTLMQHTLTGFFNKAKSIEKEFSKDMSEFTLPEAEHLLHYLNPKSEYSAKLYASLLSGYYKWANNKTNSMFNGLEKGYFSKFCI